MIEDGILKPSGVIQLRGGTAEVLKAENPLPSRRELMLEIDTGRLKCGDGLRRWNDLPYSSGSEATHTVRLTADDISSKRIILPQDFDGTATLTVSVNGLIAVDGEDYTIEGRTLNWNGLWLDGVLQAGDRISVKYHRR